MVTTNFLYNLGQTILDNSEKLDPNQKLHLNDEEIVEEYEGDCEECEKETFTKPCPICEV